MEQLNVLIYENAPQDIKSIEYLCKQYEMKCLIAQEAAEAQEVLNTQSIDILIVNCFLDKVVPKSNIKVVAIGESTTASIMKIAGYNPITFLAKPLTFASISLGLIKASGSLADPNKFPSKAMNILSILKEFRLKINSFLLDVEAEETFTESVKHFCEEQCSFSKTKSEIPEGLDKDYEMLTFESSRGIVFCDRKNACVLWDFHRWIESEFPEMIKQKPATILKNMTCGKEDRGFLESLDLLIDRYNKMIAQFYDFKIQYDLQKCSLAKHDLDYSTGDKIVTSFDSLIKTNKCCYCSEESCPLDHFFQLFQRKILV